MKIKFNENWPLWLIATAAFAFVAFATFQYTQKEYPTDLKIVFGANVRSSIKECGCEFQNYGGVVKRFNYLEGLKKSSPGTLVFDSGNYFYPQEGEIADKVLLNKVELSREFFKENFAPFYTLLNLGSFDKNRAQDLQTQFPDKFVSSDSPKKITFKGGDNAPIKLHVMGIAKGEYDTKAQTIIDSIRELPSEELPLLLSEASFSDAKKIAALVARPLIILGDADVGVSCTVHEEGNLIMATATDLGRHYCALNITVNRKGSDLSSIKVQSREEIPMSFKYADEKSPLQKKIQDWEKINGELIENPH